MIQLQILLVSKYIHVSNYRVYQYFMAIAPPNNYQLPYKLHNTLKCVKKKMNYTHKKRTHYMINCTKTLSHIA